MSRVYSGVNVLGQLYLISYGCYIRSFEKLLKKRNMNMLDIYKTSVVTLNNNVG